MKKYYIIFLVIFTIIISWTSFLYEQEHNDSAKVKPNIESLYGNYLAGRYSSLNSDSISAADYFTKALRLDPTNLTLFRDSYISNIISGNIVQSLSVIKNFGMNNSSKDDLEIILLILEQIKENNFKQAEIIIKDYNEQNDKESLLFILNAWCKATKGHSKEALADLSLIKKNNLFYELSQWQIALLADYAGLTNIAENKYNNLSSQIKSAEQLKIVSDFYNRIGKKQQSDRLQNSFLANNNWVDPALLNLSYNGIVITPVKSIAFLLNGIANILSESKLLIQSNIYAQFALFLDQDLDSSNLLIASYYLLNQQYQQAITYYNKIEKTSIYYSYATVSIANALYKDNKKEQALAVLTEENNKSPFDIEILVSLGELLHEQSKHEQAEKLYSNFINNLKKPSFKDWIIFYMRGNSYYSTKNFTKAEADLIQALDLFPHNPSILNDLSYIWLLENKNLDKAEDMIKLAFTSQPNSPAIIDTMGFFLFVQNDYEQAAKYLEKAIALSPDDPSISEHLGDVYWKMGRKTSAYFEWKHGLDNAKKQEDKDKMLIRLKQAEEDL